MSNTQGGAPPDDDIDVDFADDVVDIADDNVSLKEFKAPQAVVSDLPDSDDESFDDAPPQKAQTEEVDEGDDSDLVHMRAATAAETRARQVEAESIMRIGQAEARTAQTNADALKVALDTCTTNIENARRALAHARQSGDIDAQLQIEGNLDNLNRLRSDMEAARANIPDPRAIMHQHQAEAQRIMQSAGQGTVVAPGMRASNPLAERWAASNKSLLNGSNGQDASRAVVSISKTLMDNGWNPNSAGFYQELSKRLQTKFPNAKVASAQAPKQAPGRAQVRSPVAPSRGGSQGGSEIPRSTTKYTLTKGDIESMQRMKLDPKNVTHRKYFAKSRIESAARARG